MDMDASSTENRATYVTRFYVYDDAAKLGCGVAVVPLA